MAQQRVWILETSKTPLKFVDKRVMNLNESKIIEEAIGTKLNIENKCYIFEGPCAFFGKENENENDRWYTKEDYLSHLPYLQEQIAQNCLLGSSNHAEEYLVSMKDVSHKINKLWYDEKLDQVWIQIELIPTINGNGLDLMAIVDKNVPLFISSRATGYMSEEEGGEVTLDYIYTYDVVYRPGFAKAKLKRLTPKVKANLGRNVEVYECRLTDEERPNTQHKINTQSSHNMEYVSKEDFTTFSNKMEDTLKKILQMNEAQKSAKQFISPSIDMHIKKGALQNISESIKSPKKINESITDESKVKLTELTDDGFKFYQKTVLDLDNIYDCYFVSKADTTSCSSDLGSPESSCDGCFTIAMIYNKDLTAKKLAGEDVQPSCAEVTPEEFEAKLSSIRDDQQSMIYSLLEIAKSGGTATFEKSPRIFNSDMEEIEATQNLMESKFAGRSEFEGLMRINEMLTREVKNLKSALGVTIDKVNESISQVNTFSAFAETAHKHMNRLEDQSDNLALRQKHLNRMYENLSNSKKSIKTIAESVSMLEGFSVTASKHIQRLEESAEEITNSTNTIIDRVDSISPSVTYQLTGPVDSPVQLADIQALFGEDGTLTDVSDETGKKFTLVTKLSMPEIETLLVDKGLQIVAEATPSAPPLEKTTDQIVESVKLKKFNEAVNVNESQYPFLKKVSNKTKEAFISMSDIKKKRVYEAVADEDFVNDEVVSDVISTVDADGLDLMYASMPEEMLSQWDSLTSDQKNAVTALFRQKGDMTPEEAEQFWYSVQVPAATNESFLGSKKSSVDDILGYSVDNYLKQ